MRDKTVIVHHFDHVRAAVQAAAGRRFVLQSPPDCPNFQGALWWRALIERARAQFPQAGFTAAIDCGDCAGHAMAAMSLGLECIVVNGDGPEIGAVLVIAEQRGVRGWRSGGSDVLDLLGDADPDKACREFFEGR